MKLESIRIILIATSHPGNIGAAARAMKTMGLQHLYLVTPKYFPDNRAVDMASGAQDVLEKAVICNNLADAIADCHLIFATSARPRDISLPGLTPGESADYISQQSNSTNIAIIFGREHAGLTNEELLHCNYHINIPSNPSYSSLNLAQAVQIVAYELRMQLLAPKATSEMYQSPLASAKEVSQFYVHLEELLIDIQFLKLSNPKKLLQRLRRMFNRIRLERMEVNILRGILKHIQQGLSRNNNHSGKK